jgi:hypothetical protein
LLAIGIGQLVMDKYGRLGIITAIVLDDPNCPMVEIQWLIPRHGSMLFQLYKVEELRSNYLLFRQRVLTSD